MVKNNLEKILEKANVIYRAYMGKNNIRKCMVMAVDEVLGNAEMSVFCNILGITKKDYIDFLLKEYTKIYKS